MPRPAASSVRVIAARGAGTDSPSARPIRPDPRLASELSPAWLRDDGVAALSVWALLIPQALAYATIAGVPVQYGLYTAFAALIAYAIFGTSRQVVQGPSATVAAVSTAVITPLAGAAAIGTEEAAPWAAALALATGAVYLALGSCAWAGSRTSSPGRCSPDSSSASRSGSSSTSRRSCSGSSVRRRDLRRGAHARARRARQRQPDDARRRGRVRSRSCSRCDTCGRGGRGRCWSSCSRPPPPQRSTSPTTGWRVTGDVPTGLFEIGIPDVDAGRHRQARRRRALGRLRRLLGDARRGARDGLAQARLRDRPRPGARSPRESRTAPPGSPAGSSTTAASRRPRSPTPPASARRWRR